MEDLHAFGLQNTPALVEPIEAKVSSAVHDVTQKWLDPEESYEARDRTRLAPNKSAVSASTIHLVFV